MNLFNVSYFFRNVNDLRMKMESFKRFCLKILKFEIFENGGTDIHQGILRAM